MTNPQIDQYGTNISLLEVTYPTNRDGTKRRYDENGRLHCENGPAMTWMPNGEVWAINGKYHRVDGPALTNKTESWYVNGKLIDIKPILERLDISPDWRSWTDVEKMIVRLALP